MTPEVPIAITVEAAGSRHVVRVSGDLDMATAPRLESACASLGEATALDLAGVAFIDSSGLRALLRVQAACRSLILVSPSPVVQRLLALTNTADKFRVAASLDDVEPLV